MAIPVQVFEQTLMSFFAPIRPYLQDPSISEIMINGPDQVYIERKGQLFITPARFPNRESLIAALKNLAQFVGRTVDEERPVLEARLPDGSRVEAVLPPAGPEGPHVAIRRFLRDTMTAERLVQIGSLTEDACAFLAALVALKQNVIVAGGTGSGKTSMLNVLSSFIHGGDRVVVIEDSRELQLQRPHVVQLEARPPDARGRGAVTIRDLFRATLRMRPDRIVVGEIRGGEALDLIQAMTSGHGGCLSTVHATYPTDTLNRLLTMAMMSDVQMPLAALRSQVGSAVHFVVQVSRLEDGSRCVTHVTEVRGHDPERGFVLANIFLRRFTGRAADGTIHSELAPTGEVPMCHELAEGMGIRLPPAIYRAAAGGA
jgi:pilus assembly protein CpaF